MAIKQLNREGLQGNQEFMVEVLMLITLRHPNLVTLIGYCAEKEERLLVYEFMAHGSLENHLFGELYAKDLNFSFFVFLSLDVGLKPKNERWQTYYYQ